MSDTTLLTPDQVRAEELGDWCLMLRSLRARFRTGSFSTGAELAGRVAEAADAMNHHPDLDLRFPHVDVALTSHDVDGVTARDVRLARRISEIAAELGASPAPEQVQHLELALDTHDHEALKPFWRAVLGYADAPRPDEVLDPAGRFPALWFQEAGPHEAPHQRFHLDVHVAPEHAEARITAALEAGGRMVDEAAAPSFWVLADPDGNRACICTWQPPAQDAA
ncbi:4a-hydroxytetrahydrobiopterin dehydratase [Nocardioides panacisoli]|uniref:VOC family protein n=1 Tax=Nocardioides panacisoli TaxID=627624 RepID=UPI001C6391BD|nr:VOC family protein [Nocardioides panacisoli]QYJ04468.1 4a-hydroxytetrahydrobiopterin dehydratase [Nocardioides panacisoli]